MSKPFKCVICGDNIVEINSMTHDKKGKPVHESCFSDSDAYPQAYFYFNGEENPNIIGEHNDYWNTSIANASDFRVRWVASSEWRGQYKVQSAKWTDIHSDGFLAYSADAKELNAFLEDMKNFLLERKIDFCIAITRSSNLFYSPMSLFVRKEQAKWVRSIAKKMAKKYQDPERFDATALTGKDPADMNEQDKDFVMASKLIASGNTPEEAVSLIRMKNTMKDILKGKVIR